jgi:hypothetical protein
MAPELNDNLWDAPLHTNNKRIGYGDFDIFCISHNNDNGGNESINLHLFSQQLQQEHPVVFVCCRLGTCLGGGIYDNSTCDVTCLGRAPSARDHYIIKRYRSIHRHIDTSTYRQMKKGPRRPPPPPPPHSASLRLRGVKSCSCHSVRGCV